MTHNSMSRRVFLGSVAAGAVLSTEAQAAKEKEKAPPVPELERWEKNMIHWGRKHAAFIANDGGRLDPLLTATYYDAMRVYYQIADYTKDDTWLQAVGHARTIYRDRYVLANKGDIPGFWVFTHGLALDWQRRKDRKSRTAVVLLASQSAYARDSIPASRTAHADHSREVAYVIDAMVKAEEVGERPRHRLDTLIEQALGHYDQWFVAKSAPYVRPFMAALTAEALILCYEKHAREEILKAIEVGMEWLWKNMWDADAAAFQYTDRDTSTGGTERSPDLNLLIAPVYAWLYYRTAKTKHRDRADRIFAGGVRKAYLATPKQFDQNYRWSFDYLKWRAAPASEGDATDKGGNSDHRREK